MLRLGEFGVVALILYYVILLAIVAQIEGGKFLVPTYDQCNKYCNQDCRKYSDPVLLVEKRLDNAQNQNIQKEREECDLAQKWCECNPDPSTWGLDCRRHCHHCKVILSTSLKIICEEPGRQCDCGPSNLSQSGSGDNSKFSKLWESFVRTGGSFGPTIVVMYLVIWCKCKRHAHNAQANNQNSDAEIEIGNSERPLRNERQRININNNNSRTNNTSCPSTISTEPIIPRVAPSAESRAENGQQASIHRQTLLADVAPPPEYEPPPPYPGIAKPGK